MDAELTPYDGAVGVYDDPTLADLRVRLDYLNSVSVAPEDEAAWAAEVEALKSVLDSSEADTLTDAEVAAAAAQAVADEAAVSTDDAASRAALLDAANKNRVEQYGDDYRPSRRQGGEATPRTLGGLLRREQQFALRPGTPEVIVRACREAIVASAVPHGAVSVSAASAGRLGRAGDALVAPISVSIEYLRQGGIERRQGRVNCLLTEEGAVVALR